MRILMTSNYYPPLVHGGYELRCSETAAELAVRGHEVAVLTTRVNDQVARNSLDGVEVVYGLHLEVDPRPWRTPLRFFLFRKKYEKENIALVKQIIADFRPEIVFIWGMWNVPRSVPYTLERLCPGRVVYHISDYWPSLPSAYRQYWEKESGRRLTAFLKRVVAQVALAELRREGEPALRFEHPTCVSQAVKDKLVAAEVPIAHAVVLYSGVNVNRFKPNSDAIPRANTPIRLVYAGRLTADKGVHTAIEALAQLVQQYHISASLDIIGAGDESYVLGLETLAANHGKPLPVKFLGKFGKPQMPDMLANYDVLVFPSLWDEPFAGVVLEAMATGLVVVGTPTGGTSEVLIDGETGLVFPPGDADALARAIVRLVADPSLYARLSSNGRHMVLSHYTRKKMVTRFEDYLKHVASCAESKIGESI